MRSPALARQDRVRPDLISPALKTIMTPGRGDHSKPRVISHFLCFGIERAYLVKRRIT